MDTTGVRQHIGLFGGTFDPVHQGHLTLAGYVLEHCRLDQVLFVPALQPPHKRQPEASFAHRTAMLQMALDEHPHGGRLRMSLIEADLPAPSYTINTLEALRRAGEHRFFLIIGADSLLDLPHWHRTDDLMRLVSLIVVRRDRIEDDAVSRVIKSLANGYQKDRQSGTWIGGNGMTIDYLVDIELPVSSSAIRNQLQGGHTPDMLPPAVFAYIRQHRLYGWSRRL